MIIDYELLNRRKVGSWFSIIVSSFLLEGFVVTLRGNRKSIICNEYIEREKRV